LIFECNLFDIVNALIHHKLISL